MKRKRMWVTSDRIWKEYWFKHFFSKPALLPHREGLTSNTLSFDLHKLIKTVKTQFKDDLRKIGLVPLSALSVCFFSFSMIVYFMSLEVSPLVQLNMESLFQLSFLFPTGVWWRRRFSRPHRNIFPQQAHSKGCKEPAGRLSCSVSGVCGSSLSDWGGGGRSSQGCLRDRYQHLRWIRWWPVRDLYLKIRTKCSSLYSASSAVK